MNAIYGHSNTPNQALAIQLIGLLTASFGAGLLVYGIGSRDPEPQSEP